MVSLWRSIFEFLDGGVDFRKVVGANFGQAGFKSFESFSWDIVRCDPGPSRVTADNEDLHSIISFQLMSRETEVDAQFSV
jgi:hypothetical protein